MRLATGPNGRWVVVLQVDSGHCHVREVLSGETRWVRRGDLSIVEEASLRAIGERLPDASRPSIDAIRTDRAWGLVVLGATASPVSVRAILSATSECESELNGLLAELEAGDVLTRTEVDTGRAYELGETGTVAVEGLRSSLHAGG